MKGSYAALVEELELRQPALVTAALLDDVIATVDSHLTRASATERLVRDGWLLPLRTRSSWEFAPGARAGRYGSDDEWIELRAHLVAHPDAPVAIAFNSATWLWEYSEHRPARPVYVHRPSWRPPKSLSHLRSVRFDWKADILDINGLPVLVPPSQLAACAERPEVVSDWGNADTWLPQLLHGTKVSEVVEEAESRNTATLARLGYMAEWCNYPEVADAMEALLPPGRLPVTYFGRRDTGTSRWVNRWRLFDSVLPTSDPRP